MKHTLRFLFLMTFTLLSLLPLVSKANHISGMDLSYTHVSGNTYRIKLTVYGVCSNEAAYTALPTNRPRICIYNGDAFVATDTLDLLGEGTEVTPVCPTQATTCTDLTSTVEGIKKFEFVSEYTLPSASQYWRFVFNGGLGSSSVAGRSNTITNINTPGTSIIRLVDTLNNLTSFNNSPDLTVIPTPYYRNGVANNYNPGAVDADGDALVFDLVTGANGSSTGACSATGSGVVTYIGTATAAEPITTTTGTFSFSSSTGQLSFTPNVLQKALVVYNVREFRGDTLIGTSQREMNFTILDNSTEPASGSITSPVNGTIIDSVHFRACANSGDILFNVNPRSPNDTVNVTVAVSGLPTGASFDITGNGTTTPNGMFSWFTGGLAAGDYTFYLTYTDDACPITGSKTQAFTVTIVDQADAGALTGPASLCVNATNTFVPTTTGGTWSVTNTTTGTINAFGFFTALAAGSETVRYIVTNVCGSDTATWPMTINALPNAGTISGSSSVCRGSSITLTNTLTGGIWSTFSGIATVTSGGVVTGVTAGIDTVYYTVTTPTCGSAVAKKVITVNPSPNAGVITGPTFVCAGASITLSDTATGGTWSSVFPSIATVNSSGIVTGVSAGIDTIKYTSSTAFCGTLVATYTVTVGPLANAGTISGPSTVCVGAFATMTNTVTGGVWSVANTGISTVNTSGIVRGIASGVDTVKYTVTNTCGATIATKVFTVVPLPTVPAITGGNTVCQGSTVTLSNTTTGGTWSSSNATVASVGSGSGIVSGIVAGSATITYSVTNSCGTAGVTTPMTVITIGGAGPISGTNSMCQGEASLFSDTASGGTWSAAFGTIATVNASGLVTGVSAGVDTIKYTKTNSCGSQTVSKPITILPLPNAGVINGSSNVCLGSTITLTDTASGGVWSVSNNNASVSAGVVTGMTLGIDTVSYTVSNSCGTAVAEKIINIITLPNAGAISGSATVCTGFTTTLSSSGDAGGTWSSVFPARATVDASGIVTGVAAGVDTIKYTVTNSCGTSTTAYVINVTPAANAGVISGPSTVCVGATITLVDTSSGGTGTWSATNPRATVVGGIVTGVTAGADTIRYSVTNTCGTAVANKVVIVLAAPNAGTITGASEVCQGATTTMTTTGSGGVWSTVSSAISTITSSGIVGGVAAGVDTIKYTATNTCGTAVSTKVITVNPLADPGTISGASSVCVNSTTTLTSSVPGGTWTTGNAPVATVSSTTGVVRGVSWGFVNISYTVTNGCGSVSTFKNMNINSLPNAGSISGADSVCQGNTITLSSTGVGGTWSSSNVAIATLDESGVVLGVSEGLSTITYFVTNVCGNDTAVHNVFVKPAATVSPITGASTVCSGATITLSNTTLGGVWTSSNASVATVDAAGVVTGGVNGSATITYTYSNSCGTNSTEKTITVNPLPNAGTLSGASFVCIGNTITITPTIAGGTWGVTNTNASVSAGVVTGLVGGVDTITYSITNSCGTATATQEVTIGSSTPTGSLVGVDSLCAGSTTTITPSVSGGTWISSNTTVATVNASGLVSGVNSGIATISYTLSGSCGLTVSTKTITIIPQTSVAAISGSSSVCQGNNITLSNTTAGGVWTTSNPSVASVTSGVVSGLASGVATISYSVTGFCGVATAQKVVTVTPTADAGTISGSTTVCVSNSTTLSSTVSGGVWTTSNAFVATVNASGVVRGVAVGNANITYTVTNSCGTDIEVASISVGTSPQAGIISGASTICTGSTTTLVDTVSGGTWTSSNATVASVNSLGVVSGISSGSTIISYTVSNSCGSASAIKSIAVADSASLASISGASSVCAGATTTLGTTISGGVWSSSNPLIATVGSTTGVVGGVAAGVAVISYTTSTACNSATTTSTITVNPATTAGTISGSGLGLCNGETDTVRSTVSGGTWSSSNSSIVAIDALSGVVTGVSNGTATITYSVSGICGVATSVATASVNSIPVAGSISGSLAVCASAPSTFTATVPGGTWSSSNTSIATVNSLTGEVSGVSSGSAVISYSVSNSCTTSVATTPVNVTTFPNAGIITGPSLVCVGSTVTLVDTVSGGTWSSGNNALATVNASGIVTGVASGVVNIYYSVSNECGSTNATVSLNVTTAPVVNPISGASVLCPSTTISLSTTTSGGTWSSTNTAVATVNAAGVVFGIVDGTTTISYAVVNTCGTTAATKLITVNPSATAGAITGADSVCSGTSATYTSTITGGAWSVSNPSVATINAASGLLSGITSGSVILSYTATNSCGTGTSTKTVRVVTTPTAAVLSGSSEICAGGTTTMSASVGGGNWSSSNTAVASIDASGLINSITPGVVNISYTLSNACGNTTATRVFTVSTLPSPGLITGVTDICEGTSTVYTQTIAGGTWSSSNTAIATVSSTGTVHAVSQGFAIISYTIINSCGTAVATANVTVNPAPNAGTLSGTSTLCVGGGATYSSTVSGGTWSSSNPSVVAIGATTGVATSSSVGLATLTYTSTNTCGTAIATMPVSVNALPSAGVLTGTTSICEATTTTLSSSVSGGIWSSSNIAVATVDTAGRVTGISGGTSIISYTISNSCGLAIATADIVVAPLPTTGTISGPSAVCLSTTGTLSNTVTGGTWSSSSPSIAVIDASGIVTPLSAGTTTISYTVTNICGSRAATHLVNVGELPTVGTISPDTIFTCLGTSDTFNTTVSGGAWTVSDASIATVSASNIVSSLLVGSTMVTYTVTSPIGCSSTTTAHVVVNTLPSVPSLSGATTNVCAGTTISLTGAPVSGTWTSSNSAVASVTDGIIYGVTSGSADISYTISNSCGSVSTAIGINVNPSPLVSASVGDTNICVGSSATFTNTTSGGVWSTSDASIATVDAGGNVTGVANGSTTLSYTVSNIFGCATSATNIVNVYALPVVSATSATTTTVCAGSTITLVNATSGGVWTSSDTTLATVDASGVVTGVAAGSVNISYTVTSGGACSTTVTTSILVNPSAPIAAISGPTSMCTGSIVTFTNSVSGGTWSVSDATIATINTTSGSFEALSAGVLTVSYTTTNLFGCNRTVTQIDTIGILPTVSAITGVTDVCSSSSISLSNATSGGVWSVSDASVATISASGILTGISGGTTTVSYTVYAGSACFATEVASITVNASPTVSAITGGSSSICSGTTMALSNVTSGGVWSSSNPLVAIVDASGSVSALSAGIDTVSYSVTGTSGCTAVASFIFTVNATPSVSPITGASIACIGSTITYNNATLGGMWMSSNPTVIAIDTLTGIANMLSSGTANISYTVTGAGGCFSSASLAVTVGTSLPVPAISGATSMCTGSTITLSNALSGGSWSSSNTSVATIATSGVVSAVAAGTTTISYTVTSGSCSGTAILPITVTAVPFAAITPSSGSATLCNGSPVSMSVIASGAISYQWYNGTSILSGATSASYTTSSVGSYNVVVNYAGCTATYGSVAVSNPPTPVILRGSGSILYVGAFTTYQWYYNGTAIPGANSSIYNATMPGSYTIVVTDANGCAVTSAPYVMTATNITDVVSGDVIRIYPNPATSIISIDAPVKVNVSIMSVDGRVVEQINDAHAINVSNLSAGVYVVRVYDENSNLLKAERITKAE